MAARYNELLADLDGLVLPCPDDDDHERSWFVYVVELPEGANREAVIRVLEEQGIGTARYLPCIHLQSYMRERYGFSEGLCPIAEAKSRRTLALPFHARLAADDQAFVADTSIGTRPGPMTARGGQGEAIAAWTVWALLLVVVAVTYARVPLADLYRVSNDGVEGGLGRAIVLSNYPIALMAIALILIAADALPRRAWWAAGFAIVLCAATAVTVDPNDLDFRIVNLIPALGVVIAVGLTIAAVSRTGGSFTRRLPGDPARLVLGGVVVLLSLPWFAADLGTYLPGDHLPHAGRRHRGGRDAGGRPRRPPSRRRGALLVLTALLLSRVRPAGRRLTTALTAYIALMFAYGAVNGAEDVWHEQVVKREWADLRIPAAQIPSLSFVWLAILALAAVAYLIFVREQHAPGSPAGVATSPSSPAHP